ncbi:MAG: histidine kinase [Flavobacteriales bacterium]|nr:histidine kinase [Flavobacteriales bacterium]
MFFLLPESYALIEGRFIFHGGHFLHSLISDGFLVTVFYVNAYFLLPKLIQEKKYVYYGLFLLVILSISYLITWQFHPGHHRHRELDEHELMEIRMGIEEPHHGIPFGMWFFPPVLFVTLSTIYWLVLERMQFEKRQENLIRENLITQTSFLRSQVAPHFLFNVLNGFVSLARKKSDDLEPMMIKLSGLMQYMLYESDADRVTLKKEIDYISDYIDLQKMRFGNRADIHFEAHVTGFEATMIPPMLFIPFVENAFKHSASCERIEISIKITQSNQQIVLEVRNSYDPQSARERTSGIGISNTKKRLDLTYPGNHDLNITSINNEFVVILHIPDHD